MTHVIEGEFSKVVITPQNHCDDRMDHIAHVLNYRRIKSAFRSALSFELEPYTNAVREAMSMKKVEPSTNVCTCYASQENMHTKLVCGRDRLEICPYIVYMKSVRMTREDSSLPRLKPDALSLMLEMARRNI